MTDIYAQLKAGVSAEELAAQFSAQLNEAETRIKAEEAEKAREAEEREAAAIEKREAFAELAANCITTIGTYYPELGVDPIDVSYEKCMALGDLIIMTLDLSNFAVVRQECKAEPKEVETVKLKTHDPFGLFFSKFGLI